MLSYLAVSKEEQAKTFKHALSEAQASVCEASAFSGSVCLAAADASIYLNDSGESHWWFSRCHVLALETVEHVWAHTHTHTHTLYTLTLYTLTHTHSHTHTHTLYTLTLYTLTHTHSHTHTHTHYTHSHYTHSLTHTHTHTHTHRFVLLS